MTRELLSGEQKWRARWRWDISSDPKGSGDSSSFSNVLQDQWNDFVVKITWSNSGNGQLVVWLNSASESTPTLTRSNISIGYPDQTQNYWKYGIYKWPWSGNNTTSSYRAVAWFDEVRLGNGAETFATMMPISGGGATQTVATPTFSPAGGTYSSTQTVTLSSATSGASIRYTTDGSTPSATVGTVYGGPLAVSGNATIKAIAYKSGLTDSAVASATYTFVAPGTVIVTQPMALTSRVGSGAFFSARATGTGLQYQWRKSAADIAGETQPTLFLNNVQAADAGAYSVVVSNPGGAVTSSSAQLTVSATGAVRLVNLSARAVVGSGDGIVIPGFVISGQGSKTLLVRAVGPRLGMTPFGVPGVLADPTMSVNAAGSVLVSNDDWGAFADQAALAGATSAAGAFSLTPSTKDGALLVTLAPNPYTVPTSGVGATTGIALIELYDMDPPSSTARLVNISARAQVGTGDDVLIPGFVVDGDVAITLLIRAVGPTVGNPPFGVAGVVEDPVMTLFRAQDAIAENDDWEQAPNQSALLAATSATGAFALGAGEKDAAFLVALQPGAYTLQVAGKNNTTGVALVELYVVGP